MSFFTSLPGKILFVLMVSYQKLPSWRHFPYYLLATVKLCAQNFQQVKLILICLSIHETVRERLLQCQSLCLGVWDKQMREARFQTSDYLQTSGRYVEKELPEGVVRRCVQVTHLTSKQRSLLQPVKRHSVTPAPGGKGSDRLLDLARQMWEF